MNLNLRRLHLTNIKLLAGFVVIQTLYYMMSVHALITLLTKNYFFNLISKVESQKDMK